MKSLVVFVLISLISVASFASLDKGVYSCGSGSEIIEIELNEKGIVFDGEAYSYTTEPMVALDSDTSYRLTEFDNQIILSVINELRGSNLIFSMSSFALTKINGNYVLIVTSASTEEDNGQVSIPLKPESHRVSCTKN